MRVCYARVGGLDVTDRGVKASASEFVASLGWQLTLALLQLIVGRADVLEQYTEGPAIRYSIVHGHHQNMLFLLGEWDQSHLDHGAGGQVKGAEDSLRQGLWQPVLLYSSFPLQLDLHIDIIDALLCQ